MATSAKLKLAHRISKGRATLTLAHDGAAATERPRRGLRLQTWGTASKARAFTRQAATLLGAGFPLDRVLSMTSALFGDDRVGAAIREVQARVREGERLATALAAHPHVFSEFYRGVIGAGERSGRLAEAFERLALYLERQAELRSKLLGALLYPAVMVIAGSGAVLMLLLVVIPRFALILGDVGGRLPWTAATLLKLSELAGTAAWGVLLAGAAGLGLLSAQRRKTAGRLTQDRWLLRLPIVGSLRARLATERVTRTLAGALAGGIPLLEALEIAGIASGDAAYRRALEGAAENVRRGESLAASLRGNGLFPELAVQMIAAGEDSGRLVPLLEHVANVYRSETEERLRSLVAVVEPAIIVVFGGLVGFVALALLQTIYGIGATF